MTQQNTKDRILEIARELIASGGLAAVSFGAIAQRLGRSKQAVLYWYPTKQDLLAAMFLPWLEAEAEVAIQSVHGTTGRAQAVESFVRAIASFHSGNLDRFRLMYLLPQTLRQGAGDPHNARLLDQVHKVTDRIYGALAPHLDDDPLVARPQALAIHSAVLGLVLMFGLADSLGDPLKHSNDGLVDALIASLLYDA